MRVVALDVGEKTVGIAVSDELGITVSPRETLRRDGTEFDRLVDLAAQEQIGKVVVGLPISLNGSLGPSAQRVLVFIEQLRPRLTIPVVTWDERLTTAEAEKMLISSQVRRAKRRQVIDQIAATLILQSYLRSSQLSGSAAPPDAGFED
ncbi:MAG: Holliday junction resolvase RuvX [Armatimonadota bacterium]